jgi:pimeloyl-ACP methyl ester carboxylesterase
MGGGEVARYIAKYGTGRVAKAVFAAAVPPYLFKSQDNPEGAFDEATIAQFQSGVRRDRLAFVDEFTKGFFSAGGKLQVSEVQRLYAREIAAFASPKGTLDCIAAFGRTDFRADLKKIAIPTLIIHGDSDAIVPFQASGKRTNEAIKGSQLVLIKGAPHGLNASHAEPFNKGLIEFVGR